MKIKSEYIYLHAKCKKCGGKIVFYKKLNRIKVIGNKKGCACEHMNSVIQLELNIEENENKA